MSTFSDRVLAFNRQLSFKGALPKGIRVMNPFESNPKIDLITRQFYRKYYDDNTPRHLILGINPGRHGAGVTGVPFTDTKRLRDVCGIKADFESHEPSSVFVYEVIKAYGGAKKFYSKFYINSVCPLGFTKASEKSSLSRRRGERSGRIGMGHDPIDHSSSPRSLRTPREDSIELCSHEGRNRRETNYNYYDSPELTKAVYGFIVKSIKQQLSFGIERDVCFCLGTGKNARFLNDLNDEFNFFDRVVPLEHPRYVMQYRSKKKKAYLAKYVEQLRRR